MASKGSSELAPTIAGDPSEDREEISDIAGDLDGFYENMRQKKRKRHLPHV